mmetsp:Transcript_12623/g.46624  ORF Transcript_12623/g.46624 Transcript_12623/m.46624 type:complete len:238 (-) Transcript_12623:894-1607(-)
MDESAAGDVPKGHKELLSVRPHGLQVDSLAFAVLLDKLSKIQVHGLHNNAEMLSVLKVVQDANAVAPVLRVFFCQLAEDLQLLHPGLIHDVMRANHLDRDNLVALLPVVGPQHGTEDAASQAVDHLIARVQHLVDPERVVALRIVPIVLQPATLATIKAIRCVPAKETLRRKRNVVLLREHVEDGRSRSHGISSSFHVVVPKQGQRVLRNSLVRLILVFLRLALLAPRLSLRFFLLP